MKSSPLSTSILSLTALCGLLAASASAETISVNFMQDPLNDTMAPSDVAGVSGVNTRVNNWNNTLGIYDTVAMQSNGHETNLLYSDGTNSGVSLDYFSDQGLYQLPNPYSFTTGDDIMGHGYLDAGDFSTAGNVTVSGLNFVGAYDVYGHL